MWSPQVFIAIALVAGILTFLVIALWKLGSLAKDDANAKSAFLKLTDPASLISLLILLGILFLLGMAILGLDSGGVLIGMGKAAFARGLITYLFAVVTIGTAVVLVLSALLGVEKDKFDHGKEVLGLLLGVFGTIVGFYFASELGQTGTRTLTVSPILVNTSEVSRGGTVTISAVVQGGSQPYRFATVVGEDLPQGYQDVTRADGWIVKDLNIPASVGTGVQRVTIGVQDLAGEKVSAQAFVNVK
jgi:hypothetical protein